MAHSFSRDVSNGVEGRSLHQPLILVGVALGVLRVPIRGPLVLNLLSLNIRVMSNTDEGEENIMQVLLRRLIPIMLPHQMISFSQ